MHDICFQVLSEADTVKKWLEEKEAQQKMYVQFLFCNIALVKNALFWVQVVHSSWLRSVSCCHSGSWVKSWYFFSAPKMAGTSFILMHFHWFTTKTVLLQDFWIQPACIRFWRSIREGVETYRQGNENTFYCPGWKYTYSPLNVGIECII